MISPEITFVVAARNDDYGGNFLHRMQAFVNSLVALAGQEELRGELVIVEWNPPKGKSLLGEALTWPSIPDHFTIRIIRVPEEIHLRYDNSDRMPMFEYIAKNVGIRRAHGDFVVSTNPDLIFSHELMRFFVSATLDTGRFYRVDRHDVSELVPEDLSIEAQLAFCRRHTFLVNKVTGSLPRHKRMGARLAAEMKRSWQQFRELAANALRGRPITTQPHLHTNASGDFFMMAREHWHTLRAYPELTTHSFIDGYICFLAASMGLRQDILAARRQIYHQDHDRSDHSSRPTTDYDAYLKSCRAMLAAGKPEITNGPDWGLGDLELEEHEVQT